MTEDQRQWIDRAVNNQNIWAIKTPKRYLEKLVEESRGRCRWTGLPLKFDRTSGTGKRDTLAAVIEHRQPGDNCEGHDIVCDYINRMKGCLPWKVWLALTRTPEFGEWIACLQSEYERTGTLSQPKRRSATLDPCLAED